MINIPALRFPGFVGEWVERRLGDLFTYKNGGSFEKYIVTDGNYNLITLNSINIKGELKSKHKTVNNTDNSLNKNDLIMVLSDVAHGNFLGLSAIIPEDDKYVLNQRMGALKIKGTENISFIRIYINFNQEYFKLHGQGSSQQNLSKGDIQKFIVNLPSLPEQQKIASFLSAVDAKIAHLSQKGVLLGEYKRGMMQGIFSEEIRFRADNGSVFGDWVERRLGEVADINMGQSPESKSYNFENIGVPLIQGKADIKNRISNPRQYTDNPTKMCNIGDLILTVRAPVGAIAKSINNACIGRGVCSIRNNEFTNNEFLYQYFLLYEDKWISLEQGSTFTAVSGKDIKSLKINLPSLPEQTKIANFLSTIDRKIAQNTQSLEKMKTFKRGLLQGMFV